MSVVVSIFFNILGLYFFSHLKLYRVVSFDWGHEFYVYNQEI